MLLFLFFLSGFSALVYQVLWMRLLALVFGVTIHAASTVLAAFMAGLALGSATAGRLADRVRRPLVAFAVAEAGVAAAALATPFALAGVEALYVRLYPVLDDWPPAVGAVRFVLSFAVLIVPTTLMGATLPLVVKSSLTHGTMLGREVSRLYAGNTAGAVTGALVAGIWMISQLGIAWSFRIAALVNLAVAAVALILSRKTDAPRAAPPDSTAPVAITTSMPLAAVSPWTLRLVLLTFAVSGFVSFGLEIIWFRMLIVLFRPTTYAFTVMLATVLAGIAIGSWISTLFTNRRRHLVGVLMGRAGPIYAWAGPVFTGTPLAYVGPLVATSVVAILPTALLMGMAFPVGIAIWTANVDDHHAGERIGIIYAVNVAGAVAGSLVTAFVLLPAIGSRVSLLLMSGLSLATGLLLLLALPRRVGAVTFAGAALGGVVLVAWVTPDPIVALLRYRYPREVPVWRQEDGHASVAILRRDSNAAPIHGLYINGAHQASDTPTMVAYHRLIGTLPVAIHNEPRRALVIGAGGGATAGAVAAFSDQTRVDVVELSPAVAAAAAQFSGINQNLLTRPNAHLEVDDGRNYMLLTDARYDIITADVIVPMHAGAGNLYSVEYYRLMRRVLNRHGIAIQWIGSAGETEYKLIMRTFLTVFPHTTLWHGGSLMVGSTRPLMIEEEAFLRKQASAQSKRALDGMGFKTFESLLSQYDAGPVEIKAFLASGGASGGPGPILTDDRPLTEYFLSLPQNDKPVDLSKVRGSVRRHVIAASPPGS